MQKQQKEIGWWEGFLAFLALVLLLGILVAGAGCATAPGQVSIIEWDSRSKEQIEASVPADVAVYENAGESKQASERAFAEWKALFDMISGLRVRIRVIWIQWGSGK